MATIGLSCPGVAAAHSPECNRATAHAKSVTTPSPPAPKEAAVFADAGSSGASERPEHT
jgi:hypothetical protein